MTDNFDPWSYEDENYFYVYDPSNMTYNLTQYQKLSLNLNAGDEVEVICASRAVFDDTKDNGFLQGLTANISDEYIKHYKF